MITVKHVETETELKEALAIQDTVFVAEQGIPAELTLDKENANAEHALAYDEGEPVGTARLLDLGDGDAELARVAVLANYRKTGAGQQMIKLLEEVAKEIGIKRIELHPHIYLERYYGNLGYTRVGGVHQVGEYPLITMEKFVD